MRRSGREWQAGGAGTCSLRRLFPVFQPGKSSRRLPQSETLREAMGGRHFITLGCASPLALWLSKRAWLAGSAFWKSSKAQSPCAQMRLLPTRGLLIWARPSFSAAQSPRGLGTLQRNRLGHGWAELLLLVSLEEAPHLVIANGRHGIADQISMRLLGFPVLSRYWDAKHVSFFFRTHGWHSG